MKIDGVLVHQDVTAGRVTDAVLAARTSLGNPGFCICCGTEIEGVEPDARKYECEYCGFPGVYGAEELLIHLVA
jgi:hypothetical protein